MNSHAKHTVSVKMLKIDSLNTFTTSVKCITPLNIFFLFYAHFQISFRFDQCVYRNRVSSRDQWNFRIFRITNNIFVKGIYNCLNTLVELCISYTFFLLLVFRSSCFYHFYSNLATIHFVSECKSHYFLPFVSPRAVSLTLAAQEQRF